MSYYDYHTMKVSRAWYDVYLKQGKRFDKDQERQLFGDAVCLGYGLYNYRIEDVNGEYICTYKTGSSCD